MNSTVNISYPGKVQINLGLVMSLFLLYYIIIWTSIMRISKKTIPTDYEYLTVVSVSIPFGTTNHAWTLIPSQNRPSVNMIYNGSDPNNNTGIQRFTHLHIPTTYQCLIAMTISTPTGEYLILLLMLMIGTMAITYILDQQCVQTW